MTGNIQYLRTDRAIQSAFLTLLSKKPFEKITVQDILDTTPVSRATFYKHYHDKFEIAERIQDELLTAFRDIRDNAYASDACQVGPMVEQYAHRYKDTCRLLMKVRTERVDLSAAVDRESRNYYMSRSESPTRELEAKIYGAAISAFMTARIEEKETMTMDQAYTVMVPVALRLMGMPNDPDFQQIAVNYR